MTETDRLESLELKCMDLENTVNALNEQLVRQYADLERFRREIERLESRLDNQQSADNPASATDEVPPHY